MRVSDAKEMNVSCWLLGTGGDGEARQEYRGVAAELAHQLGVAPQRGGADQAAHLTLPVSGNDKNVSGFVKTQRCRTDGPSSIA